MNDLRLALRLLRLRPGFCAAIVLTLAVGLGASTAIFSLVYALLLRPLPFADPGRLVVIDAVVGGEAGRLTLREYRDLERDSRAIEGYAAYYRSQYNVTGGGAPDTLTSTIASSTLFTTLGVAPVHGDVWSRAEDFTRQSSVVISHRLWRQRFGARPDIAGQSLTMDGSPYRVLGVMPEGFDYPVQTDVFRAVHRLQCAARAPLFRPRATASGGEPARGADGARHVRVALRGDLSGDESWRDVARDDAARSVRRTRAAVRAPAARCGRPAVAHRQRQRRQPVALACRGPSR
jgi:hypothetical protein